MFYPLYLYHKFYNLTAQSDHLLNYSAISLPSLYHLLHHVLPLSMGDLQNQFSCCNVLIKLYHPRLINKGHHGLYILRIPYKLRSDENGYYSPNGLPYRERSSWDLLLIKLGPCLSHDLLVKMICRSLCYTLILALST